jgi:hypothetical protein
MNGEIGSQNSIVFVKVIITKGIESEEEKPFRK